MIPAPGREMGDVAGEISEHLRYLFDEGTDGLEIPERIPDSPDSAALADDRVELMAGVRDRMGNCTRCRLHMQRTRIVFGEGSLTPEIVFVGEGPGYDEDRQGRPFVGRAGKLLDRIITAMGVDREDVYITNIVKCRPPGNRNPETDEAAACTPFLLEQLDILRPKVICALGNIAAAFFIQKKAPMAVLRGKFYDFQGICVRPTYHPAALLRNPAYRRPVWEDVQDIMQYLGRPVPRRDSRSP